MLSTELSNVEFHCGRAEDLVPAVVSRLASQQLIAILDPPRAGLREWHPFVVDKEMKAVMSGWHTRLCNLRLNARAHCTPPTPHGSLRWGPFLEESISSDSKVILAIRRAENLKRLLYVSCNPRAAMGNFVE